MQGLIQKSGYIKPGGGAGNYAEYIATRDGVELLNRSGQYMEYIAERPRSHGLFSNTESVDLEMTMKEVSNHPAPVWTFIYSLRREDAARLGYDSAASWRRLLLAHQTELAEAMKILPKENGCYELLLLELTTGLRRGELLALQWDDLDFQTGELYIQRQVQRIRGELTVTQTCLKRFWVRLHLIVPGICRRSLKP